MITMLLPSAALAVPRTTRLERLAVALLALTAATALVQLLGLLLRAASPWNALSLWLAGLLA